MVEMPSQAKVSCSPDAEELRSHKREVVKLKAERDILKRAAAYFARDHL